MGLSNLVYPGANHTRFHHAVGCLDLMQKAVRVLRAKEVEISIKEENALCIAILLHDLGHGPFSHALENSIVNGITHEEISLKLMNKLNEVFDGQLSMAIEIFTNKYQKKYMHQLISSQLDIDRLDYLKRDSFYTGVAEGNISSERLIAMMNVVDDELVIEKKGIYSVEKFLISRSFMYWQVYLHKTGLVAESLLVKVLQRAKELTFKGEVLFASHSFQYFLQHQINEKTFNEAVLETFSKLDDYDIISSIKAWVNHQDKVLSKLSQMIVNRELLKIDIEQTPFPEKNVNTIIKSIQNDLGIKKSEMHYFVFTSSISNKTYDKNKPIKIIDNNGKPKDVLKVSDLLKQQRLSKPIKKYFICYPKKMLLA